MKNIITFLGAVLIAVFSFSQATINDSIPVDPNTKLITFQEVVQQEGTKEELFNRASEWLHHYFEQPVYVTNVRDAASGIIKGKHQFEIFFYDKEIKKRAGLIKYYFKIECREGRYRYTLDNFVLIQASRYPCEQWLDTTHRDYNEKWPDYLRQIRNYAIDSFAVSLKEYMVPEVKVEEEEW